MRPIRGYHYRNASPGFSLVEVLVGMAVLGIVLAGLASYSKTQRGALHKTNKHAYAAQGAAIFSERQKTWFADTTLISGKTRSKAFHTAVGTGTIDSNWTWSPPNQGATTYQVRIQYRRIGAANNNLLRGRGTITWDGTHTYTWGFLLGMPKPGQSI
jgi:prepilin-type N-terminal cleavage/methylation domain-containing protein